MRKFQCLLFVLKRLYICYYMIYMTVPLTLKNLPNYEEKELSSSIEHPSRGYKKIIFRSLQVAYNTYESVYKELLSMNSDVLIHQRHLRFLVTEVFKSVNDLNQHFMWDYF